MPICKIKVGKILGENAVWKFENISLSHNKYIVYNYMSDDVENVLCDKLKNDIFSIKLGELTDLINKCYVPAFVRFVNEEEIHKHILCSKELLETGR